MKLFVTAPGAEKPGLIDKSGQLRDLSAQVRDLDGEAYSRPGSPSSPRWIHQEFPPSTASSARRAGHGISKFVAIGLDYVDHAKETGSRFRPNRFSSSRRTPR